MSKGEEGETEANTSGVNKEIAAALGMYKLLFAEVGNIINANPNETSATHILRSYQLVSGEQVQVLAATGRVEEARTRLLQSSAHAFLAAVKL